MCLLMILVFVFLSIANILPTCNHNFSHSPMACPAGILCVFICQASTSINLELIRWSRKVFAHVCVVRFIAHLCCACIVVWCICLLMCDCSVVVMLMLVYALAHSYLPVILIVTCDYAFSFVIVLAVSEQICGAPVLVMLISVCDMHMLAY